MIDYENENTGLDFKATQYSKDEHGEFLCDVIAMANADWPSERYIIVGVKHVHGEPRQFLGIAGQVTDPANLQQLVRQNVEPDLSVSYEPLDHNGVMLGVIRIQPNRYARPYLMKKDFLRARGLPLRKGDGFVRKGTHKDRLGLQDLETIFAVRHEHTGFTGELYVAFAGTGGKQSIALPCVGHAPLPSDLAATEIGELLDQRRLERERQEEQKRRREEEQNKLAASNPYLANMGKMFAGMEFKSPLAGMDFGALQGLSGFNLGPVPYAKRTDEQLHTDLESVRETYGDDDYYDLYELRAAKVNFEIENRGREYLEDASIRVTIDGHDGRLVVVEDPPEKPNHSPYPIYSPSLQHLSYPTVRSASGIYVVTQPLGDLKHGIPATAFRTDLRIVLSNELAGVEIPLTVELLGRNLPHPIQSLLYVEVVCEDELDESKG